MSITTDCAEGRHAVCRGAGPNHHFPQTSHLGDQPCACSCHVGEHGPSKCEQCGGKGTVVRDGPSDLEYDSHHPCPRCTTDRTALKGTGAEPSSPRGTHERG